jgi:hypothetical protein
VRGRARRDREIEHKSEEAEPQRCTRSAEWFSAAAKASASLVPGSPLLEMVSPPIASLTAAPAFLGRKPTG